MESIAKVAHLRREEQDRIQQEPESQGDEAGEVATAATQARTFTAQTLNEAFDPT